MTPAAPASVQKKSPAVFMAEIVTVIVGGMCGAPTALPVVRLLGVALAPARLLAAPGFNTNTTVVAVQTGSIATLNLALLTALADQPMA